MKKTLQIATIFVLLLSLTLVLLQVRERQDTRSEAASDLLTCSGEPLDLSTLDVEKKLLPLVCSTETSTCGRWDRCVVPERIVLHTTAGARTADETYNYFAKGAGGRGVGTHFVIGSDGKTIQLAELYPSMLEYTAGVLNYRPHISIEMTTAASKPVYDNRNEATNEQYQATMKLVLLLMQQYNIPLGNADYFQLLPSDRGVYGHYQLDPLRKTDPGWGWMRDFREDLEKVYIPPESSSPTQTQ